jgi:hypothetical protein
MTEWEAECASRKLISMSAEQASSRRALMSKYRRELDAANWIGWCDPFVWNRMVAP